MQKDIDNLKEITEEEEVSAFLAIGMFRTEEGEWDYAISLC